MKRLTSLLYVLVLLSPILLAQPGGTSIDVPNVALEAANRIDETLVHSDNQKYRQAKLNSRAAPSSYRSNGSDEVSFAISAIDIAVVTSKGAVRAADYEFYSDVKSVVDGFLAEHSGQVTWNKLQKLAAQVSTEVRKTGLLMVHSYFPPQETRVGGALQLIILPGVLGEVSVSGNVENTGLLEFFGDHIGSFIYKEDIQKTLNNIQNMPGVAIQGTFIPGDQLGETKLKLNVGRDLFDGHVYITNTGSEYSGRTRYGARFQLNSFLNFGDSAEVDIAFNEAPNEVNVEEVKRMFGRVKYSLSPFSFDHRIGIGGYFSNYAIGNPVESDIFATFGFGGESLGISLYNQLDFHLWRFIVSLEYSKVEQLVNYQTKDELVIRRDVLAPLRLSAARSFRHDRSSGSIEIEYTQGLEDTFGSLTQNGTYSDFDDAMTQASNASRGDFNKWRIKFDYNYRWNNNLNFKLRYQGQMTGDPLLSSEQFSVGGPSNIRAYPVSSFLADRASYVSFETYVPIRFGSGKNIATPKLFYDLISATKLGTYSAPDNAVSLSGIGIGFDVETKTGLSIQMSMASAFSNSDSIDISEGGDSTLLLKNWQFYGTLLYRF